MIRIAIILSLFISNLISSQNITSEDITLWNDSIEISGTLTYTKTKKTPLLIYISGSGNVDRNGNQKPLVNANYTKLIRERMSSQDIAFFSYDKRTANPKNTPYIKNTLFPDMVEDAKIVAKHFKNDNRFNEIILVGHSQGSLVGMLISEFADKFISLAGPGESIDKKVIEQISNQAPQLRETVIAHAKELRETQTIKQINPALASVFGLHVQKFMLSWMQYDPSEEIKRLKIPILIINGDRDFQVTVEDAKALHEAVPKSKLVIIKDMNHVLKIVTNQKDNQNSYYYENKFPLSDQLIETMVAFIKE